MARTDNLTNFLTDVANAIREKTGETDIIYTRDFDTKIMQITAGSSIPNLQNKDVNITTNGTYTLTSDTGYDGLNQVNLNVQVQDGRITNCDELFRQSHVSSKVVSRLLPACRPITAYKMFEGNTMTGDFDVTSLDMSQCTTAESMFENMQSIASINVSNFNVDKCTIMQSMFLRMAKVIKLDLTSFNTSQVTNMGWMFYANPQMQEIDLSSFDFSNVTEHTQMFDLCGKNYTTPTIIYVKDEAAQKWILDLPTTDRPSTWSTENVIIKEVASDV